MHRRIWTDGSSRPQISRHQRFAAVRTGAQLLHGTCKPLLPPCRNRTEQCVAAAAECCSRCSVSAGTLADAAQTGRGTLRWRR